MGRLQVEVGPLHTKGAMMRAVLATAALVVLIAATGTPTALASERANTGVGVNFQSLDGLTVDALRKRRFGSVIKLESDLARSKAARKYAERFFPADTPRYASFMASYRSDGLRLYTRVDLPTHGQPRGGYPVIVFAHGYVGYEAAREFHFSYTPDSMYAEMIDSYVKAGFVVITPGYRGHGTVNGVVADGRASMAAWDNATHVSPILYAIDTVNLLEGLQSLERIDWSRWKAGPKRIKLNLSRLAIAGHSQGGDVTLITLAITGKGSKVRNRPIYGSIVSGTFPDRFTQVETFRPMSETPQAFLAGDGTWTGSATGKDGGINPHFVFGWPADSLPAAPDQFKDLHVRYPKASVREVIEAGYAEMYRALNEQVRDLKGVTFSAVTDPTPKGYRVVHDPRVAALIPRLGAFHVPEYISARLSLHFPDRDFYSLPAWNRDLCTRINAAGGACTTYEYPGNTHGLRLSSNAWFSPPGSREGYGLIFQRDSAAIPAN